MTRDTEDVVARRAAIRDILYRLLPQEIDADVCRAVADEFLALEASDRQSLSDRIDVLTQLLREARPHVRTMDGFIEAKIDAALHQEGIAPK